MHRGHLAHASTDTFDDRRDDSGQSNVSLLMPPGTLHLDGGGALFPALDMNLPEGYERVAAALKLINLPATELARFFEQVALTAMVRNGDGHLKNFGVLYSGPEDVRLAPLFDVVTTSIYKYQRFDGGPALEDHTMALQLFADAKGSKIYPHAKDLLDLDGVCVALLTPQQSSSA